MGGEADGAIPASNPGYKLLVKEGWDERSGLGRNEDGRVSPVKLVERTGKAGVGATPRRGVEKRRGAGDEGGEGAQASVTNGEDWAAQEDARRLREKEEEIALRRAFSIDRGAAEDGGADDANPLLLRERARRRRVEAEAEEAAARLKRHRARKARRQEEQRNAARAGSESTPLPPSPLR